MRTVTIDGVKKTFHEAHQDMWNELSQNPGMTKDDYFEKHKIKQRIRGNCFACESCQINCTECPIIIWRKDAREISRLCPCAYAEEYGNKKSGSFAL